MRTFDSVLCFGDSDWWYHNRGHADMQFMRRFARICPTVYVNSLGVKVPRVREGRMFARKVLRKLRSVARFYRDGGEGFGVMSPLYVPTSGSSRRMMSAILALQIRSLLRLRGMSRPLIWVACPTAAEILPRLKSSGIVHQLSDCYGALNSGQCGEADRLEEHIADRADLVLCASEELLHRAQQRYGKGEYLDHGVDYELFTAATAARETPPDLAGLGAPIIGFFGNIDGNTVDRDLLDRVIPSRPQYRFVLVGPMARDFEMLRRHRNLTCVPQKPYAEIPRYGAAFDVCLMPWLDNEWIRHCNPIKLKEYLALGKPVVSTPFPELRRTGDLCYAARGPEAFAEAIDRALAEDSDALRRRRQQWASKHTWDAKFDQVINLLEQRGIHLDN